MIKINEIKKMVANREYYDDISFVKDAKEYIKSTKNNSMFCIIDSVSQSGMSRNIRFLSVRKDKNNKYNYRNYIAFFEVLGFKLTKDNNFKINGCGMDMIFNTNYTIIHRLYSLGFINAKTRDVLAQNTPNKF